MCLYIFCLLYLSSSTDNLCSGKYCQELENSACRKGFPQHNTNLPAQMTVEVDNYQQKQLKPLERKHSKLESSIHNI